MNSIPAVSSAFRSAVTVDICAAIMPGLDSSLLIVGSETDEAVAKSRCSHRRRARAARIDSLLSKRAAFPISISFNLFNTWGIDTIGGAYMIPKVSYRGNIESIMPEHIARTIKAPDRRSFIGGSDARIIMGNDEVALLQLWREKCGEVEPVDLSGNLIVQLGAVTEDLNRRWYELNTGQTVTDIQRRVRHPVIRWLAATLDGRVESSGAVFEAKFMLPWSFSEEAAAEKHMPQLQHNMWVVNSKSAVLSVITGGGKWVEIATHADPLYQHLILTAEKKFWRCVETGEPPCLFGVEPPRPRIEAIRIVDMSASNAWAEFAGIFGRTRDAHLEHEEAKAELKSLMPEDAKQAVGHGVRAKRSKSGSVSFDLLGGEVGHASV
jgi:hypothetical protein